MKKNVIFFSNPFGFGPTAKAIAVMNAAQKLWDANIHYVTDSSCLQIFNIPNVNIITGDIRNIDNVRKIISDFENSYVVSSINKFAIIVANELKIPNAFIDSLTWMWDVIPNDYLLSDFYFALNFPNLDKKIQQYPSIIKVPYIIDDTFSQSKSYESDILVNIGGCMNPLTNTCPEAFLTILFLALKELHNKKIVVCGGKEAISILNNLNLKHKTKILFTTLEKETFMSSLLRTKHFVTISGLNSSFEAFYYQVPTSFIMPTNLSQWKNLNEFIINAKVESYVKWEDILSSGINLDSMSEKEAIRVLELTAKNILISKKYLRKATKLLYNIFIKTPDTKAPYSFINSLGTDGAYVIAKRLKKEWVL